MKKQAIALMMASLMAGAGSVMAAAPTTVTEKTAVLEETIYGSVQDGAILDRVNQLDTTVYGAEKSGTINDKVDSLYTAVEGDASSKTAPLAVRMDVLEYTYQEKITNGSMLDRLDRLERSVFGKIQTGTIGSRISKLTNAINGSDFKLTPQVGTLAVDKVFKITLDDEVNTKVNKVGDTIHFTVAENIMDGDVLLVPAGTAGTGTITTLKKAGVFGRNAKLDIKFDNIPAIDGTEFVAVQGEEAQEEAKKSQLKAGGASVAGAVLLGPVGLLGGAFIKGNNIDLPAGSTIYVQPESPVTIQGVVIGGDGLNHANDLVDATEVTEEPVEDVDAVSGEAVDTTSVDEATTESVDENGQDVEETTDEVVDEETEEPVSEEDTADTNDKEALKTSSVVEESKPALNVSKPIVVVKRS